MLKPKSASAQSAPATEEIKEDKTGFAKPADTQEVPKHKEAEADDDDTDDVAVIEGDDDDDDEGDEIENPEGDPEDSTLTEIGIETENLMNEAQLLTMKETFFQVTAQEGISPGTLIMARHLDLLGDTSLATAGLESFSPENSADLQVAIEAAADDSDQQHASWIGRLGGFIGKVVKALTAPFRWIIDKLGALLKGGASLVVNHPIATVLTVVGVITGGAAIASFATKGAAGAVASEEAAMGFFQKIGKMFSEVKLPDGKQILFKLDRFGKKATIKFIRAQRYAVNTANGAADAVKGQIAKSPLASAVVEKVIAALRLAWDVVVDLPKVIARNLGDGARNALMNHQSGLGRKIYEAGGKRIMSATTSASIVRFVEANVAFIALTSLVKMCYRGAKRFLSFITGGGSATPAPAA